MNSIDTTEHVPEPVGKVPTAAVSSSEPALALVSSPRTLSERAQVHLDLLADDQPPSSYLESLLHVQCARNAAALDVAFELEAAEIDGNQTAVVSAAEQTRLNARRIQAIRAPKLAHLLDFKAKHEKGLHTAVRQLTRLQHRPDELQLPAILVAEADCIVHLIEWAKNQSWSCPSCGSSQRYWLASRPRFECQCGRQYSLRTGTIYEGSHLPLATWFAVIAFAVCHPRANASQIARFTETARVPTIRTALQKVREALASEDGEQQLAGIPQLVLANLPQASGPHSEMRSKNGNQR
jgi:transposase-like protein